jgi:hypothetical protein
MDWLGHVAQPLPVLHSRLLDPRAARANGEVRRHVQRHIVAAEIRIELGLRMEREMREPTVGLQARQLGEPLRNEVIAARIARALDNLRQLRLELELEREPRACGELGGEGDLDVGFVLGISRAVLLASGPEIGAVELARSQELQIDVAELTRLRAAAAHREGRAQEQRALVLEGVQIQMKEQRAHWHVRRVDPLDGAAAQHPVRGRVEPCFELVRGDQRLGSIALRRGLRSGSRRSGLGRRRGLGARRPTEQRSDEQSHEAGRQLQCGAFLG